MKRQVRATTEKEILDRIDRYKKKMIDLMNEAEEYNRSAAELAKPFIGKFAEPDYETQMTIDFKLSQAIRLGKARARIEDSVLPKLKAALAEFRTELLPFTEDRGVVLK